MRMLRILAVVCGGLMGAGEARAQIGVAGQLGWGDDSDIGLGARGVYDLSAGRMAIEAAADFMLYFPGEAGCAGCDFSWWELNANLLFPLRVSEGLGLYAGGGLNMAFIDIELPGDVGSGGSTDTGLNLLAGMRLPRQSFTPYLELRTVAGGASQFVITVGVGVGGAWR